MQETQVQSLGQENLLNEELATHSDILAWKNPTDRGAWKAAVQGVAEGRTRLSDFTFTFHFYPSVQFSSVAQSFSPTLCDPMNRSTPGLPVHHHLPEFTQTQVHRVGDAIQPSHPLSSPSPPAPNPSQHQSHDVRSCGSSEALAEG